MSTMLRKAAGIVTLSLGAALVAGSVYVTIVQGVLRIDPLGVIILLLGVAMLRSRNLWPLSWGAAAAGVLLARGAIALVHLYQGALNFAGKPIEAPCRARAVGLIAGIMAWAAAALVLAVLAIRVARRRSQGRAWQTIV